APTPTPVTLTVTSTSDSGAGSLRAAIFAAENGNVIQFDPALNGQTITLITAELLIDKDITISGPGSELLSVWRPPVDTSFRVFHITPGRVVTIEGLKITGGSCSLSGGGILNDQATLVVDSCRVDSNTSLGNLGGGISNEGASAMLTLINSSVTG